MSLISALRRQRQADLCEFEASLVYRKNSSSIRATHTHTPPHTHTVFKKKIKSFQTKTKNPTKPKTNKTKAYKILLVIKWTYNNLSLLFQRWRSGLASHTGQALCQ